MLDWAQTATLGGVILAPADSECFHTGLPAPGRLESSCLAPMFGLVDLEARTYRVVFDPDDKIGLFGLEDDVGLPVTRNEYLILCTRNMYIIYIHTGNDISQVLM